MIKVCLIGYCMNQAVRERIAWGWRSPAGDTAIWNTQLIDALAARDDIELHVIAPANHMKHLTQSFDIGRVKYRFFKTDVPLLDVNWMHFGRLDQRTNYWWTRRTVQKWIREINPDIVNLTGAENPHYAASILGLKGYPVLVSMQGIYSNPVRFNTEREDKWRTRFERLVHAENRYFGLNAGFMKELILRDCSKDAFFFWNRPLNKEQDVGIFKTNDKKFDFVFFSRMNANKGALDLAKAAAIVRKSHPDVTIRLIGRGHADFEGQWQRLADELGVSGNFVRSDGYTDHDDLMREVASARYHILPTYIDTIPCTIFEGLRLGLPFVGYKTGDIPKLNIGDERVLLVEPGDVEGLAAQMIRLLDRPDEAAALQHKAVDFVERCFSNKANIEQFLAIYRAVIDNYCNGMPIPRELMYDEYLKRKLA